MLKLPCLVAAIVIQAACEKQRRGERLDSLQAQVAQLQRLGVVMLLQAIRGRL